jgi:hypothetical protein
MKRIWLGNIPWRVPEESSVIYLYTTKPNLKIGGESFQTGNWIEPIQEEEGIDGVEQQLNLEEGE